MSPKKKITEMPSPASTNNLVDVHQVAVASLENLRRRRDAAADKGLDHLEEWVRDQKSQMEFHEAVLAGREEPLWSMARHEAFRNAYRALLTGEGALAMRVVSVTSAQPEVLKPVLKQDDKLRLFSVFERWKASPSSKVPKTIADYSRAIDLFLVSGGPMMASEITRQHIIVFREHLVSNQKLSANTVNKYLAGLGSILTHAMNDGLIDSNPAHGVTVRLDRHAREARLPFDVSALSAIFSSPVFSQNYRPVAGGGEAAYWLPFLALYTGARLEELGQLHPEDVYEETYVDANSIEKTAWVIRFTDRGEGQELKNSGSRRRIPVHQKLIELGFIDYVIQAKAEKRQRIFHMLKADISGHETGNWSKWFGRYLRSQCKVTDTRMVFHSFRHTFKHLARLAGVPKEINDAITGHSSGDVADLYGGLSYPLAPLVEGMGRYRPLGEMRLGA